MRVRGEDRPRHAEKVHIEERVEVDRESRAAGREQGSRLVVVEFHHCRQGALGKARHAVLLQSMCAVVGESPCSCRLAFIAMAVMTSPVRNSTAATVNAVA